MRGVLPELIAATNCCATTNKPFPVTASPMMVLEGAFSTNSCLRYFKPLTKAGFSWSSLALSTFLRIASSLLGQGRVKQRRDRNNVRIVRRMETLSSQFARWLPPASSKPLGSKTLSSHWVGVKAFPSSSSGVNAKSRTNILKTGMCSANCSSVKAGVEEVASPKLGLNSRLPSVSNSRLTSVSSLVFASTFSTFSTFSRGDC